MGKKKTTSTQINKPVYAAEIGQAAGNVQNAYNQSAPVAQNVSNNMAGLSDDLLSQIRGQGSAIGSANTFLNNELTGDPTQNPYLDQMLDVSNNRVQNQMQAAMGKRGLSGGSDYTNLISRALAENETGVRYNDYNQAMQRRMQAAGMSGIPTQTAAALGQQGAMLPSQLAALQAAGVGGLLGQYQDVKGTQTQSGGLLGSILRGALGMGASALMTRI
jgi:hypothetical protein